MVSISPTTLNNQLPQGIPQSDGWNGLQNIPDSLDLSELMVITSIVAPLSEMNFDIIAPLVAKDQIC